MRKFNMHLILISIIIISVTYLLAPGNDRSDEVLDSLRCLSNRGKSAIKKIYTPSISLEKLREEVKKIFEDDAINPITYDDFIHDASPGNYTITRKGKKIVFTVYGIEGRVYDVVEFSEEKYLRRLLITLLRQAFHYHESKEYEKAIKEYNKAIKINPQSNHAYNHRGNIYFELKQYKKQLRTIIKR